MENATQDPSGATDTTVSDGTQTIGSTNTITTSGGDTVAYDTHKKLLGEKKRVQAAYDEAMAKLNTVTEEKLSAEGKKDELLEAYKKRIEEMEGKVNNFAYSSVASAVRLKAQEMGCVDAEALVQHLDLSTLNVGDNFSIDDGEVKTILEAEKKNKPYFFRPVNPNVNNSTPNINPNVEGGKVDFGKMSKDELIAFGKKNGL